MMKSSLAFTAVLLGIAQMASAGPICVTGTLASYEALGSGGCMIGLDTVASFNGVTGFFGATPVAASSITVTPFGSTTNPALTFALNQTASTGHQLEAIFTYVLSGQVLSFDRIQVSGTSFTGDGVATDIQNFCVGGNFGADGVTGCTGSTSGALLVVGNGSDQTTFSASTKISVTDDFTLDGGNNGSATGGTISDQFATPEPTSILLSGMGIAMFAFFKLKLSDRNVHGETQE